MWLVSVICFLIALACLIPGSILVEESRSFRCPNGFEHVSGKCVANVTEMIETVREPKNKLAGGILLAFGVAAALGALLFGAMGAKRFKQQQNEEMRALTIDSETAKEMWQRFLEHKVADAYVHKSKSFTVNCVHLSYASLTEIAASKGALTVVQHSEFVYEIKLR